MSLEPSEAVEITQYMDYVPYLRDVVQKKRVVGEFSFRNFCQKSGFRSPTYLKWVLDEKRPISPKSTHRFAKGLDLGKREQRFLDLLVRYKESENPETKRFFFEEILKRRERKEEAPFVRDRYEYLSHWYTVTIRELVVLPDFDEDPHWIRKKLRGTVGAWEIKDALATLERLQLIVRDDRRKWRQNEVELHTGKDVQSLAAFQYHKEVLELSGKILTESSHEVREVQSLVALIDQKTFVELRERLRRFQDEMVRFLRERETAPSTGARREIFMLNMQLLPFSRFEEKEFLEQR